MNRNSKLFRRLRRGMALVLALALVWAAALPVFAEGTEAVQNSDTIYINSADDLAALAQHCAVDSWSRGKTVILQEDISLSGIDWEPIPSFSGSFRGNGHEIRDLELEGTYSPAGLFATVEEGAVIESLSVQGWVAPGGEKSTVGGIAGINKGTIANCQFTGAVEGGSEVGGIVGRNEASGVLDRCTARCIVTGKSSTGGIAGQNLGSISSCTNVGAVNADYQDTTLNLDGLSADLIAYVEQRVNASAEPLSSNAPTDTGGIAGRSSGMILSCNNTGTVGYEHLGYNVGGIVGRTDGLVSGCVNQGTIFGRKDVGGIAGQAEPYLQLDLSQSTLEKLRTELDRLHDVVDNSADVMDNSSSIISSDLDALQSQMNTAINAARQLQEQGSDYVDDVADEVDRTGVLVSDTLSRMEPVLDSGKEAVDQMTDALDELKWAVSEASMEISYLSSDLEYIRKAAGQAGDAMDDTQKGLELIEQGFEDLRNSYDSGDDAAAQSAIGVILSAYDKLPSGTSDSNLDTAVQMLKIANAAFSAVSTGKNMSVEMKALSAGIGLLRSVALVSNDQQLSAASRQITQALRSLSRLSAQMGTLAGNASSAATAQGRMEVASALDSASRAFSGIGTDLGDLEDILTDLGFDVDGLQSGADSIEAGLTKLSDAATQLRDATDDLETGLAWMERDGYLVSSTVQRVSDATADLKDSTSALSDTLSQLKDIVSWLGEQDPISMPRPSAAMQDTTNTLFDAMDGMSGQMDKLNQNLKGVSDRMTDQVRAINDQISVVTGLLLDAVEEISDPGSKTVLEDDSERLSGMMDGKLENCTNRGTVQADVDVGGIAGAIAVENLLDPEDDTLKDSGSLLRTGYSAFAVVDGCINEGTVEAKKDAVGGIVGRMDLGLVQNCEAYGDVTGSDGVGGIAGQASAKLKANWAKCRLSGSDYVGGIVGQGTDSRLTDGSCTVVDCRALVDIREADQYAGAISGGQEGTFSGNLFVSDTLRGIDRLSKTGQAEPTTFENLVAQENVPQRFKRILVTFTADDHLLDKISVDYGASITEEEYPDIPAKEGYAARWDSPELTDLHVDTMVEVVYTQYVTALSSNDLRDDGRPVLFAEGLFGDQDSLTVSAEAVPDSLPKAVECWNIQLPDDGQEQHTIRYLPQDSSKTYKVYVQQDGKWNAMETDTIGSYTTFAVDGTAACIAIVPQGVSGWIILAAGAAAAAVLAGALLLVKKRKRRTAAAKPE